MDPAARPTIPLFGAPEPGFAYPDRPAAFGVAVREGRLAIARITIPGFPILYDLPGGGIDPGESEADAMAREFGEEVGLRVTAGPEIARADQFFVNPDGERYNVRSVFFVAEIAGEAAGLKIEADHELVWLTPDEAMAKVRRESHAWAVAAWLRR
jgi:8-oxo-dGTP diphosphatase